MLFRSIRLKTSGTAKLLPKYIGPYEILSIVGYRLKLSDHFRIHDVFQMSLLEPYLDNGRYHRYQPPPATVLIDGEPEYQVEQILDSRKHGRRTMEYLVQWGGYGSEHNTWEPECNLENAPDKVQSFWDRQKALGLSSIECSPQTNVPVQTAM